jgi:hypothetical protein
MIMGPTGPETKNDYAGEHQQHFTGLESLKGASQYRLTHFQLTYSLGL